MKHTPKEKDIENDEIEVLNQKLMSEYTIEELEERLETDPLFLTTIFSEGGIDLFCACKKITDCPTMTCGCDGVFDGDTCACKKISGCPTLTCGCNLEYGKEL